MNNYSRNIYIWILYRFFSHEHQTSNINFNADFVGYLSLIRSFKLHTETLFTSSYGVKSLTKKPRGSGKKSTAYVSEYSYFRRAPRILSIHLVQRRGCVRREIASAITQNGKFAGGKANEGKRIGPEIKCAKRKPIKYISIRDLNLDIGHNTRKYPQPMLNAI